ncbi:MAG: hypothetical protein CVV04_00530 [Firmicutes bacterium HGW-Firmicutes-9]|jgi:NADH:ubiquinone oxidoreductase subunit E|nr:MAG: hypothetical protein CVV04_00530 [Firmicutes bacterium HGW-Firmicutes-9]
MDITVCIGSSCHLKGSRAVVERLEQLILDGGWKQKVALSGSFCMGQCQTGVSVRVDGAYHSLTPETTEQFFLQTILPRLLSGTSL